MSAVRSMEGMRVGWATGNRRCTPRMSSLTERLDSFDQRSSNMGRDAAPRDRRIGTLSGALTITTGPASINHMGRDAFAEHCEDRPLAAQVRVRRVGGFFWRVRRMRTRETFATPQCG